MNFIQVTATWVALLVGTAAAAEPVAVEYLADRKAFRSVKATDVLVFELYEDESCSVTFGGATGWRLDATTGVGNAETTCKARCLSW